MKKYILLMVLCSQSFAYYPEDINQFRDYQNCIKCNLKRSTLASFDNPIEKKSSKYRGSFFSGATISGFEFINASLR